MGCEETLSILMAFQFEQPWLKGAMVYIGHYFLVIVIIYSQCLIRSNKFSKYNGSGINSFLSYIGVAVILARTI